MNPENKTWISIQVKLIIQPKQSQDQKATDLNQYNNQNEPHNLPLLLRCKSIDYLANSLLQYTQSHNEY